MDNQTKEAAQPLRLLTPKQTRARYGLSESWLAKDRISRARIPHIKIGRKVAYRPEDIEAFIAANVRRSTSDRAAA